MPVISGLLSRAPRSLDFSFPSLEFSEQWTHPADVFSVLLLVGGDVVSRAVAQLAGSRITPVAFSFGWVAYAVTAVVSAVGENKLMPLPDCACKVINGRTGYSRDNGSWIIGRMVRDFDRWKDNGAVGEPVKQRVEQILVESWDFDRKRADEGVPGSGQNIMKPLQAGLCVSIYRADEAKPGHPGHDLGYYLGFFTSTVQLGIASIPLGVKGHWDIILVTTAGIILAFATGSIEQWSREKWACRRNSTKTVILTRGNGSQHAIVVVGTGKGLDLEDLAASPSKVEVSAPFLTRLAMTCFAAGWVLLLITAAGIKQNTWYLLAVGGVGILQNIYVAGYQRLPIAFGVPLTFEKVIGEPKAMDALFKVEEAYPHVGRSMLDTFFPGKLRPYEERKWKELEESAHARKSGVKVEAVKNMQDTQAAGTIQKGAGETR